MIDYPFETLLESKASQNRWYPTPITIYKHSFKLDMSIENSNALLSNIAYNMQYMEYLEKSLLELNLSSVIYTMLIKTYIITGMSILEGIFSNIVKSNGWWKTSNLESLGVTQSNETNFSGDKYVIRTELLKHTDEYSLQMNLDELIKVLSRHHDALSVDHLVYPALKRLKALRNRIHLQKNEDDYDHDFNAFNFSTKKEMGKILFDILTSPTISNRPQAFDFLKINI